MIVVSTTSCLEGTPTKTVGGFGKNKTVPAITADFFKEYRPLPLFRWKRGLLNLQNESIFYNSPYIEKARLHVEEKNYRFLDAGGCP
jgi:hypothetical protein